MADANASGKNWWRWFEKDTLISIVSALGLDVIFELIKKEGPLIAWTHVKDNLQKKILTDKRAGMLREFRMMNDAGINIDNLIRRHAESMDRSKIDRLEEYRFVELLCKIPPPDPADPSTIRPPATPGAPGIPQNDRQADLKWLNDMGDEKFKQMMYFLDHDVIVQWYQIGCDRAARILKMIWEKSKSGLKDLAQWLHTHFGALGDWLVDTAEAAWNLLVRFFRWLTHSWPRVAAVAVISLPILIFVALIVGPIRRRVFPWFGTAIGVLLATIAYYLLVPTSLDKTLSLAFLVLLAAAFFLWKFAPVRNTIFVLLAVFTLIFFLGGRTAAWAKWETASTRMMAGPNDTGATTSVQQSTTAPTDTAPQRKVGRYPASPEGNGQPADANGEGADVGGKKTPPAPLATIYPLSGDKGDVIPIMYGCYHSSGDVVTCNGSAQNNDDVVHGVYLMDSQGVFNTPTGGGQFSVWTFGGSLQFVGGTDFARLIPGMQSPFVFSFRENTGKAQHVGITLFLKSAADSINHSYTFANIPVVERRS